MTWGASYAPLLIVGLAPGLKGANRTGRPFTGDASGDLLFESLFRLGLAGKEDDEIILQGCAITNAIACVPPQNRPIGEEVANCRGYLTAKLTFPRTVLVLGKVAHDSVLKAMGVRLTDYRFSHGAVAQIAGKKFVSSFHPSRYNVTTKRINTEMMDAVIRECLKP